MVVLGYNIIIGTFKMPVLIGKLQDFGADFFKFSFKVAVFISQAFPAGGVMIAIFILEEIALVKTPSTCITNNFISHFNLSI